MNWLLMAAVVLGLGMSVTSCKDDDEDEEENKTEEQKQQEAQEKADRFWNVMIQLAGTDAFTTDYEGKTFEPVIGEPSDGNPYVRIVYTNDLRTAAQRFGYLVDADINEDTNSFEWKDDQVGKLSYRKTNDGQSWATVDVSIKAMPHLQQIIYRSPEQGGDNKSFDGKAYYRFGDVISRTVPSQLNGEGSVTEYWICVRPAFGPEKKQDSHWVCLNALPDNNIFHHYSESQDRDYYVPTGIGEDKEHMQNLAELLYAICLPDKWQENIDNYSKDGWFGASGLPLFHDFTKAKQEYHNKYFWQNVAQGWNGTNIAQRALNISDLSDLVERIERDGITLLYKGYSWWTTTSWNCTLWQASFTNGSDNKEKNLHHAEYEELKKNVKDITLDCRKMGDNKADYQSFFGDNKLRWCVRVKTGKQLSSDGSYDEKKAIKGCKNEYRYYEYFVNEEKKGNNKGNDPEITEDPAIVGKTATNAKNDGSGTYMYGDVVMDEHKNRWFCITGSPYWPDMPGATDKTATFLSFDFNEVDITGNTVEGLPTEEEIKELAYRLSLMVGFMSSEKTPYKFDGGTKINFRGIYFQHIYDYANVDMKKFIMTLDSTFVFTSKGITYNSGSSPSVMNVAYNDGSNDKQAIARIFYDDTQAGNRRDVCVAASGTSFKNMYNRAYLHYETFDTSQMQPLSDDEKSLGMTWWNQRWAMTKEKMYLQDITNQDMVNRHAADDKWVTLPLYDGFTHDALPRRTPRTTAVASARPADYIGQFGRYGTPKTNMFNEPVAFLRVMKVTDNGGPNPTLVSQDGRHLTVVHLQNIPHVYNLHSQAQWGLNYSSSCSWAYYLDNEVYKLPPIPGF